MRKVLICPGERRALAFLAESVPLVLVPVLGENLLAYWMESVANAGIRHIEILATDRPDLVRAAVRDGSRWGARVHVRSALQELTPAAACEHLAQIHSTAPPVTLADVVTVDHLPGLTDPPPLRSYRDWFAAVVAWMPRRAAFTRIGMREVRPDFWCGRRTRVSPTAQVHPPCWLGDHVQVGADAVIGPHAVLEDRVIVDSAAEIHASIVGPDTFVGALTRIDSSLAWGSTLIDWRSGSCTQVPDPFLLSSLNSGGPEPGRPPKGENYRWRNLWRGPWHWMQQLQGKFRG